MIAIETVFDAHHPLIGNGFWCNAILFYYAIDLHTDILFLCYENKNLDLILFQNY